MDRREKEKWKAGRDQAKAWVEHLTPLHRWLDSMLVPCTQERGDASKFIESFNVKPGDRVVILWRVSTADQGKTFNQEAQKAKLREHVEGAGGIVVSERGWEWSGRGPEWIKKLTEAASLARQHNAILLAATTDRFIRHPEFKSNDKIRWKLQATTEDLVAMRRATGDDIRMMTFLHPNASPEECKSLLTKWGQTAKDRRGGRPPKTDRKDRYTIRRKAKLLPIVLELYAQGKSTRDIKREIAQKWNPSISHVTIAKWVKKYVETC